MHKFQQQQFQDIFSPLDLQGLDFLSYKFPLRDFNVKQNNILSRKIHAHTDVYVNAGRVQVTTLGPTVCAPYVQESIVANIVLRRHFQISWSSG